MASEPPKVLISYSHDSAAHKQRVLALAERLRSDGVNAQLDQYVEGSPAEGWPRWMHSQLDQADFALLICTETYYRRFWRRHETEFYARQASILLGNNACRSGNDRPLH